MLHQSLQAKTLCMASMGAVYAASVGVHLPCWDYLCHAVCFTVAGHWGLEVVLCLCSPLWAALISTQCRIAGH